METAQTLSGGYINDVLCYRTPDGTSVVKYYTSDSLSDISHHERLQREALGLERHSRLGIAPRLLAINPDARTLTMEYIPSTLHLDEYIRRTDAQERDSILYQAGSLLREVHQPVAVDSSTYLIRFLSKAHRNLERAEGILTDEGIDTQAIAQAIEGLIKPSAVEKAGITYVHRDPWLNNFLYQDTRVVGLIDWELSGVGSPYEDFAIVDLWIAREHGDIDAFWKGYGENVDRSTQLGFALARCVQFLAIAGQERYNEEKTYEEEGFYMNKVAVIKDILASL